MEIKRPKSIQPIPEHAKRVFQGVMFDVYQWEQEMFDGSTSTFETLKRPDTVIVFPVLPDGNILLIEEEQPGRRPSLGASGGRVDDGEAILDAVKRELLEETGCEAEEFVLWDAQQPASKVEWVVYTFVAKGLKQVSDLKLDAGEKITPKMVTLDELIELGLTEKFMDKVIAPKLMEAKYNPEKKKELEKLFSPTT